MEENKKQGEEYINAITVSNTFFDFILDFKKEMIYQEGEKQKKDIENIIKIRMSPQMAKALAQLLNINIESYEQDYGIIPTLKRG